MHTYMQVVAADPRITDQQQQEAAALVVVAAALQIQARTDLECLAEIQEHQLQVEATADLEELIPAVAVVVETGAQLQAAQVGQVL